MVFSKKNFLNETDKFEKRLYSKFLDEMDGKEVTFNHSDKYGEINIKEDYIIDNNGTKFNLFYNIFNIINTVYREKREIIESRNNN